MATVKDLKSDGISGDVVTHPWIIETCGHTFDHVSMTGQLSQAIIDGTFEWDFRAVRKMDCMVCREEFGIENIAVNDAWQQMLSLAEEQNATDDTLLRDVEITYCTQLIEGVDATERVNQYLVRCDDPLIERINKIWNDEHFHDITPPLMTDLLRWYQNKHRQVSVFNDLRPIHLHNSYMADSRVEAFSKKEWSFFESLLFIIRCIYHLVRVVLMETVLYLLYFWGYGFLQPKQYEHLRATYVVRPLVPLYLDYLGCPTNESSS